MKDLDSRKEAPAALNPPVTGNSDIWEEIGQETQGHLSQADDRDEQDSQREKAARTRSELRRNVAHAQRSQAVQQQQN